ncbi:MAG: TssN family type VI secretion system protein [Ferruginibacter sp.]
MERLLTNELLKYIIILGAGAVAITAIMARLITKLKGSFKPFRKSTIIYLLLFILFFAAIAITTLPFFFNKIPTSFIFLQAYFLLLGGFHVFFLDKKLAWAGGEKTILPETLFTVLISLFGCIAFLIFYHWLNKNGLEFILSTACIFFIIPFFFYHSFQSAIIIPPKVLKQWFYPVGDEIEEPDDSKLKNLVVISFEFQKYANGNEVTNFRAKAPRDMEFGQLFYFFINDYNLMHPNSRIQFTNESAEPQGWIFFKKPRWHTVVTRYIDFEKTIFTNHITENEVIICTRAQI